MKVNRSIAIFFVLSVMAFTTGCPKDKDSRYHRAAEAVHDFALAVQTAQQAEIALHNQGIVQADEHQLFQQTILDVAKTGQQMTSVIRQGSHADVNEAQTLLDAALSSTRTLLDQGVGHVKNDKAKAELTAVVLTAKTFLDTIAVALR